MTLEIRPIEIDHDDDPEGRLVLRGGRLVAVLSRLSENHPDRSGHWFLECGFGLMARCDMEFDSLASATAWIEQRLDQTNPG